MAAGSTTRTSNSDEKSIEITASDPRTGFHVYYDGTFGGDAGNVVAFCGKGKITVSSKTAHEISVRPRSTSAAAPPRAAS